MRATVPMVARKGRASYLGERSVGHQDPGATSVAIVVAALERAVRSLWPGRGVTLVFGVLDDKELGPMLRVLLPMARRVLLTSPASPRARDPESYLAEARAIAPGAQVVPEASQAIRQAVAEAPPGELVLVCGSLYLVAEGLAWLGGRGPQELPVVRKL